MLAACMAASAQACRYCPVHNVRLSCLALVPPNRRLYFWHLLAWLGCIHAIRTTCTGTGQLSMGLPGDSCLRRYLANDLILDAPNLTDQPLVRLNSEANLFSLQGLDRVLDWSALQRKTQAWLILTGWGAGVRGRPSTLTGGTCMPGCTAAYQSWPCCPCYQTAKACRICFPQVHSAVPQQHMNINAGTSDTNRLCQQLCSESILNEHTLSTPSCIQRSP